MPVQPLGADVELTTARSRAPAVEPAASSPHAVFSDADEHPHHDARHAHHEVPVLSPFAAGTSLMKSMVGSGILALPWALKRFGVVSGLIGMVFTALINVIGIRLLLACRLYLHDIDSRASPKSEGAEAEDVTLVPRSTDASEDPSRDSKGASEAISLNPYEEVASRIIGPRFAGVANFLLAFTQLGVCTAYADTVTKTVTDYVPGTPRLPVIFAIWVAMTAAGFLRGLNDVSWIAQAGLMCYGTVFLSLAVNGVPRAAELGADEGGSELVLVDWSGFGWYFGISMFAFEGIGTVLPIVEEMRTFARPERFRRVVDVTYVVAFFLYSAVGFLGYVCYREETESLILFNFPPGTLTDVTRWSMAAMFLFTFTVQIYPIHHMFDEFYAEYTDRDAEAYSFLEKLCLRGGLVLVPCGIAVLVEDVGPIIDLVGSLSFSFLGIIAPAVMYHRIHAAELSRAGAASLSGLVFVGVAGGLIGAVSPFVFPETE